MKGLKVNERLRAAIPSWIKHNEGARRYLVPEEVTLVLDTIAAAPGVPRTMFDVGAHIGSTALPFLRHGWQVVAFEPDPTTRAHLTRATAAFAGAITIEALALSDEILEAVPFYSSAVSSGISGLHAFDESHVQCAEVSTTTLRQYCHDEGVNEIGFLKIDVEGMDLAVLRGVDWERGAPAALVCEFDQGKALKHGHHYQELCEFLDGHGYSILVSEWYPVVRYGGPHRWRSMAHYPHVLLDPMACGNLIAFQDQRMARSAMTRSKRLAPWWRASTLLRHKTGI